MIGFVLIHSVIYRLSNENEKSYTLPALVFAIIFATLIMFNYIMQFVFIPSLVRNYDPQYNLVISVLSMSNPQSLSWGIEMFGYGLLGLASLFLSHYFTHSRIENITAKILVINGIASVIGAFITAVNISWVLTIPGLISYLAWNILVIVLMILLIINFKINLNKVNKSRIY